MCDIKIINLKKDKNVPYDLYIGRPNAWMNLSGSKWANPFVMKKESMREEVVAKYEEYVRSRPDLMESLVELRGKTLACYCKPKKCHGDVLVKLYNELFATPPASED